MAMVPVHLLMSCFITDVPIQSTDYYGTPSSQPDKLAQLLTTIHSLRELRFQSSSVYVELDQGFEGQYSHVDRAVSTWLPESTYYSKSRLAQFGEWQAALGRLEDSGWILLMNNHDHPFVSEYVDEWEAFLEELDSSTVNLAHISHWPEVMGWRRMKVNQDVQSGLSLGFIDDETIGTVLVRTAFLKHLFETDFTEGKRFVRPDNPFGPNLKFEKQFIPVPKVEFFRHLDGYGHVGLNLRMASALRNQIVISGGEWKLDPWRYAADVRDKRADLVASARYYATPKAGAKTDDLNVLTGSLYMAVGSRVRFKLLANLVSSARVSALTKLVACARLLTFKHFWVSLVAPYRLKNVFAISRRGI